MEFLKFATSQIFLNLGRIILITITVLAVCFYGFVFIFMSSDAALQARYDGLWPTLKWLTAAWCVTCLVFCCWMAFPKGGWNTPTAKALCLILWVLTILGGLAPIFFV
ncbi:MAG: hypothetical protein WA790_14180 [Sulfitobacter sp.]